MKRLKLKLEYQCFPVWEYDQYDRLVRNDLPEDWTKEGDLEQKCIILQEEFDNLYTDNGVIFEYVGFQTVEVKEKFIDALNELEDILKEKAKEAYEILNDVDTKSL